MIEHLHKVIGRKCPNYWLQSMQKKINFFKRKANHVKVTTNRCVSNRKIRKEGFGLPSGIAGIAHSFSASSSSVSLVWDVSSVKAPLECPLQVCFFLFYVS